MWGTSIGSPTWPHEIGLLIVHSVAHPKEESEGVELGSQLHVNRMCTEGFPPRTRAQSSQSIFFYFHDTK